MTAAEHSIGTLSSGSQTHLRYRPFFPWGPSWPHSQGVAGGRDIPCIAGNLQGISLIRRCSPAATQPSLTNKIKRLLPTFGQLHQGISHGSPVVSCWVGFWNISWTLSRAVRCFRQAETGAAIQAWVRACQPRVRPRLCATAARMP